MDWLQRSPFQKKNIIICRQPGQGGAAAAPIDEEGFKAQLLEREAKHEQKRKGVHDS